MMKLWGWVPNLSGNVLDPRIIGSRLESEGRFGTERFRFEYMESDSGRYVRVSVPPMGDEMLRITLIDVSGLCCIEIPDDDECMITANAVWKDFRTSVDGCKDMIYDCTAMDRLVLNTDDPVRAITRRFIDAFEIESDFSAHVVAYGEYRGDNPDMPTYITRSRYESNRLYFDAFMDMYSECLDADERERIIHEADRRIRKNNIISDYLDRRYQRYYNRISYRVSIVAVLVALAVGLFGVLS